MKWKKLLNLVITGKCAYVKYGMVPMAKIVHILLPKKYRQAMHLKLK